MSGIHMTANQVREYFEMRAQIPQLLAEVERLRKQLEDCKRQIKETADLIRDRGEPLHATDLDNFLEWME